ncbi:MAG: hypothetical protein A2007_01460 [Verrucomicrobia bacterium GWC2_42_7]|nr:MAG: hypothetical protein A2007_01460 [Verrucomicrobia bacterium GWC2_42_7]
MNRTGKRSSMKGGFLKIQTLSSIKILWRFQQISISRILFFLFLLMDSQLVFGLDSVVAPSQRKTVLKSGQELLKPVDKGLREIIINDLYNPFTAITRPPIIEKSDVFYPEDVMPSESILSPIPSSMPIVGMDDLSILKEFAQKGKATGSYFVNNKRVLVFKGRLVREGDSVKLNYGDRSIAIVIERVDDSSYTLRLNQTRLNVKFNSTLNRKN